MKPDEKALAALKDGSMGRGPATANDGLCKAAKLISRMSDQDRATMKVALEDPDISSRALWGWIQDVTGEKISPTSVQSHRGGRCVCR